MAVKAAYWYKTREGNTFIIGGRPQSDCPCPCHKEQLAGDKIVVSCNHCQMEQSASGSMAYDARLEQIVKTILYNAYLPDQQKLVAWATEKLKETMAEYAQELKT